MQISFLSILLTFMSRGIIYMLAATVVFSLAYVFVKKASMELGFWEAAFFRALIGFLILSFILIRRGENIAGKRENRKFLFLRGTAGSVAMILYFAALSMTSMANASSLHYTHPLFTTLLAVWLLKERISGLKAIFAFFAMTGVFIILRPDRGIISLGSFLALLSGFFASLAYLTIRYIGGKESSPVIINWLCIMSMVITGVPMLFFWRTPSGVMWFYLILVGVLTTLAQELMTLAYRSENASTVAAFSFTGIIWATIAGKVVFRELPGMLELGGILIIFFSMAMLVVTRNKELSQRV